MTNTLMVAEASAGSGPTIPDGIVLRRLDERDIPSVGEAYWRSYLQSSDEMTLTEARDDVLASWRGEYGCWHRDGSIGAWQGGELVGAVITVVDAPWTDVPPGPFITDLFVIPHVRRRGIGRALVQAVQHGLGTTIALRVDNSASEARALYAALGFHVCTSSRS